MSWERTKSSTTALSPAPSAMRWALAGVLVLFLGALLFILHATATPPLLAECNIWWLSLTPPGIWLLLFCIRGWQREREVSEHTFLQKEAERAQKQWEDWAERYLVVLGSCVLLPDSLTAGCLYENQPQYCGLARRISYLPSDEHGPEVLLRSIGMPLQQLPESLPLRVTLIADGCRPDLAAIFAVAWAVVFPDRTIPDDINVTDALSLHCVEERLRQPVLTVDLILVMQQQGGHAYSDGLAALLLTSDDVAQKYHLPHAARLLRPMPLAMSQLPSELTLFLETQTAARRTSRVFCDSMVWHAYFADLLTTGAAHQVRWKPEEIAVLEKWTGIPGPAGGWLLLALLADTINLRNTSVLGLFTSDTDHFVSTITPGSEKQ